MSWPLLILRLVSCSCCPPVVAGRRLPRPCGRCDALPATAETIQGRFVTLFYGILRPDGRLTYCNCGHNPPILARAGGGIDRLDVGGMAIGFFDGVPFAEGTATLGADDHLVVFSDGVTEALNAAEEEFGDDRLVACLASVPATGAESLREHVFAGVQRFTAGAAQHDDITAMVVAYHSPTA